jgi:galactose-1-phosphate uridylyltransferase
MEVMQVRQRLQSSAQTQKEEMKTTVHNMFSKALPDATPAQKATLESIVASALGDIFTDYPVDDALRDMIPIYQDTSANRI